MKKPELLVTPKSVEDIQALCDAGADAFLIGEQKFGLRLAGEFSREDMKKGVQIAHKNGKKLYAAVNVIVHNELVDDLYDYIKFLDEINVDAVVFGDPSIVLIVKEVAPNLKLHWSTETTGTNWYTCNYWGKKGAKRAVLAREISMDEIIEIKENAEVEIEIQVHGMNCMFQSKRNLLGNYYLYQGKAMPIENRKQQDQMFLHDKERQNKYPIFEDVNGTHIMSPADICMIDELRDFIDAEVDSFKIDGILKSSEYILEVTKLYRKAIDSCVADPDAYEDEKTELFLAIKELQPKNRPLDTGFFFKETVY